MHIKLTRTRQALDYHITTISPRDYVIKKLQKRGHRLHFLIMEVPYETAYSNYYPSLPFGKSNTELKRASQSTSFPFFFLLALGVQSIFAPTNPGGAQALGKEFPASAPRVIQEAIKFP
jgi:hypothetical protein